MSYICPIHKIKLIDQYLDGTELSCNGLSFLSERQHYIFYPAVDLERYHISPTYYTIDLDHKTDNVIYYENYFLDNYVVLGRIKDWPYYKFSDIKCIKKVLILL